MHIACVLVVVVRFSKRRRDDDDVMNSENNAHNTSEGQKGDLCNQLKGCW